MGPPTITTTSSSPAWNARKPESPLRLPGVELEFESVPPKKGKRMRRKLRKARVALPEALVLAGSVLPQRQNLVTLRPPGYVVRLRSEDLAA